MRFSLTSLLVFVTIFAVCCWLAVNVYPFGQLMAWFLLTTYVGFLTIYLRNVWLRIGCFLMIVLGVLATPVCMIDDCILSPYLLEQVKVGSTTTEVESLLGSPTEINQNDSGETWLYFGSTLCHIFIDFDDGTVTRIDHDH